ncbi:beta-galactosidase [Halalkalibacter sp. APA_J-10(15)]|uniref:beta-galactosidase n=1 Tax=Halalkalibacter sp. APA_J-10(15) TaxID=2933805 RepID=UPI001FF2F23E|nr:beta-galactosidase [Halalkalibacter sp. APA_J-10(15)]MCK0471016.1 beta-galactosidase [Halalkalibacter sp. APA_J-10(15)]
MEKVVVFYDETFPYEGERPSKEIIERLRESCIIADAQSLDQSLDEASCIIHMHGAFFPKNSWTEILRFLNNGNGLVYLGGAPFKIPVYEEEGEWKLEVEQLGYHRQLHILETLEVAGDRINHYVANEDFDLFQGKESLFDVRSTYSMQLHVTRTKDVPNENGSGGPMDAHFYPLLKGVSKEGRHVAAPAVLLEHTKGEFTGGRWMFVNQEVTSTFWEKGGVEALVEWAEFTSKGVTEIWVKPNYASYFPGEKIRLLIQIQELQKKNQGQEWTFRLQLTSEKTTYKWSEAVKISSSSEIQYIQHSIPFEIEPGYYDLMCQLEATDGQRRTLHQGIWGYDQDLLMKGEPLSCGRDYFEKEGKPFPIVGMTYMTSDVARKYLFLPNAATWDRDMRHMKEAGINYIRTGLWTGWRQVMFVDGHPYEEVMRAIDAFILTAKKHDLEVTFNFFSFTPERWEGENPYLDPRSVEAQKRFISAVVMRHKETTNIQWDLINEPSMFDEKRIFKGPMTSGDRFEREAFRGWLRERHSTIQQLQEHWDMTPNEVTSFEEVELPEYDEINFSTTNKLEKKGNRWLDYSLFSMDMHNQWARELTKTIKTIAPQQLVTVGQDEALGGRRPSPLFYAEAVDYTTVHSWWLMDHLVWDSLFTKDPLKPNVVQETGIMHVERPDGRSKRSEIELKSILERKYAYGFATGGAGAVQWLWNTNHYMDNINESNIGAIRSDQTEKPETDVSYDFGSFIKEVSELFRSRKLEEVAVIYPYSNDLSNREFAFSATAKLTRVLTYDLRIPFRAFSEYHLDALNDNPPKLIIVPSAHNFHTAAYEKLCEHVRKYGGMILWTGPLHLDEYWRHRPRTTMFGKTISRNIIREERLEVDGEIYPVSFLTDQQLSVTFGKNRLAELETEIGVDEQKSKSRATQLRTQEMGKGTFVWCPLPIELNNRDDSLRALYEKVLDDANVTKDLHWEKGSNYLGVYGRKLTFARGNLFVFVSEEAHDVEVQVEDPETGISYQFTLESDRSVLFATNLNGEITAVYRPNEVEISAL